MITYISKTGLYFASYQLSFVGNKVPDNGVRAGIMAWICSVRDLQNHHLPLDHVYTGLRNHNFGPRVWMKGGTTGSSSSRNILQHF